MALDIRIQPVEKLLFHSEIAAVGMFRCPATHELFQDSGPIRNHLFAFPRSATLIRHEGGPEFVGSPNHVSLYNRKQLYGRKKISEMDASDWYAVSEEVLLDAIAAFDPGMHKHAERPFRFAFTPIDSETYLRQRRLCEVLARKEELDPLTVEEEILAILGRVLSAAYARRPATKQTWIEPARRYLAADVTRNIPLRRLAETANTSPFSLCREFHQATGMTLTHYKHSLRLRLALERLRDRRIDLTTLALDLGYSSHSHFTAVFRRHFGVTPSAYRDS